MRAFQWACLPWRRIKKPSVVGAVIDLGRCLDLTTQDGIETVQIAHRELSKLHKITGQERPKNSGTDKGKRNLDCAVIKHLHRARAWIAPNHPYQTVRALFVEGKRLYRGAGFHSRTHVQLCVASSQQSQILGVFRLPAWQQDLFKFPADLYPPS